MNKINNESLYQVLGINKNATHDQIIKSVSQDLAKKDISDDIGKASMVLLDPVKKKEYDRVGWKEEWGDEWRNRKVLTHSVFEAIFNEFKETYRREEPESWKYAVYSWDLDSSLWAPMNDGRFHGEDAAWITKIYSIIGENWRQKLEDYRDKMINAIRKKYQENKQNNSPTQIPKYKENYKEKFDCDKCGKFSELFPYLGRNGKKYCSYDCLEETAFKQEKIIPYSPNKFPREKDNKERLCDKCQETIGRGPNGEAGYGSVDNHGNHRNFCSKNCCDTFSESWTSKSIVVIKRNAFIEILKWMKKQGIDSIRFDRTSDQLLVEYSGKVEKPVAEKDLTPELKEIKDYYQESSEDTKPLSREVIQQEINKSGIKPKNEGNGMLIFGLLAAGAIIFVLMGVIFHKKRTKRY